MMAHGLELQKQRLLSLKSDCVMYCITLQQDAKCKNSIKANAYRMEEQQKDIQNAAEWDKNVETAIHLYLKRYVANE